MKVAIYGQSCTTETVPYIRELVEVLESFGSAICVEGTFLSQWPEDLMEKVNGGVFSSYADLDRSFDFFFSLGGDGTILRTVLYVRDLGIPILGINTGRLGFLATVQKEDIAGAIAQLEKGRYRLTPRSLLQIQTNPGIEQQTEVDFALNEIAISRKNTTSMITIATWLNGEYLTSYWADGLIVASPTGSTGYSLSCNGPVIAPDTNAMVLTPIAPHNLNARPLVIPDNTRIRLKVSGREQQFLVSLDSRIATLDNATELNICKAPFVVQMVDLEEESFLKTLRKKLLWGEDKRN